MASKSKRKILRSKRKSAKRKLRAKPATRKDHKVTSKKDEPKAPQSPPAAPVEPQQKVDPTQYQAGAITYLGEPGERPPIDPQYPPAIDVGGVTFKMGQPVPMQMLPPGLADQLRNDPRFVIGVAKEE